MAGEAEQLGAAEGTLLEGTIEHSGPSDAIGDAIKRDLAHALDRAAGG